jgi:Family of unknown function (DUF5662)
MDSRVDTYRHKLAVLTLLKEVVDELLHRAVVHDDSKLESPELEGFDEWTGRLAEVTYDSDEYREALAGMAPFLEHHYACNTHHPQHWADGVKGMSLLDLIEMLADWKASTQRTVDGDLERSIEVNQQRFGYPDEVREILLNTARELMWVTKQ